MSSIALQPTENHAEGVHGIPWTKVWRIRNGVASTWFRRYRMLIPFEEFASAGNIGIAKAIVRYVAAEERPGPSLPFPVYLSKCLHHDMAVVVRREWTGWASYERSEERDTAGRRKLVRLTFTTPALDPLPPDEMDDATEEWPTPTPRALQTTVPYEDLVYIREGLAFVATHVTGKRLDYLQRTLHGEGAREIAAQYGIKFQPVQNALKRIQARVQRWAEAVSYAAAE